MELGEIRANNKVRRLVRGLAVVCASIVLLGGAGFATIRIAKARMGPPPIEAADALSTIVVDRDGRLLRAFTTPDGRWRLPVEPDAVDPRYLKILMAFEDRRFHQHPGIDFQAFARSGLQLLRKGRIISGGSTLTMQAARLLEGRHERTGAGKFRQIVRALQLEERLSKKDILRIYLRLAPMGGNIEGVRAASLAYFGKEPDRLSIGEAALLVAIPQSPEARRPDRNSPKTKVARDRVLDTAVEAGVLSKAEAERAKEEAVPSVRRELPKFAPHLAESEAAAKPQIAVHRLTLDRDIQSQFEVLATEQTKLIGEKLSSALLAVDNATGEVIAYVGSAGYLDSSRSGAIDMVQAIRSPGSTLKPLIYGLGFEAGLAHPETLIEDRPTRFGLYAPENFDEEFHGTVTVRQALGNSLNIPAVKMLAAVGPGKLISRMGRAGVVTSLPADAQPSLAIALGGLGMRLQDLAQLYTGLARGGDPVTLTWLKSDAAKPVVTVATQREAARRRLLSAVAAWYVTDILKDAPPPANTKGGRIAYKTGTSYGYRDAWAIGFDGRYTIAVWTGRPDGLPTPGLMGRNAAAPMLFDAFARIAPSRTPFKPAPSGALRVSGADLPPPLKRFRNGPDDVAKGPFLEPAVVIAFPPDRSELDVQEREEEPLVLKAEGGALPLTWLVDGAPIASDPHTREVAWQPDGRGFVKLQVVDAKGTVDRVTVRLR
ncbi:MAG: penicillin-binding protein 1C [Hyphomicrobium sp.]